MFFNQPINHLVYEINIKLSLSYTLGDVQNLQNIQFTDIKLQTAANISVTRIKEYLPDELIHHPNVLRSIICSILYIESLLLVQVLFNPNKLITAL